ncbi:MAG: endonuclease MutS2 [Trueperaceae bacterium]|nr:endonuclease MutS2 [Trueperaceae bacterium]
MKVSPSTLSKLDFTRVCQALSERASTLFGAERALALAPTLTQSEIELSWRRIDEVTAGADLALGGVHDIRPFIEAIREGKVLEGEDILQIAYTMDAAGTIKRSILASERLALGELAMQMRSFDGALRQVREQLDLDGRVRDDATPKLRDIRRRLRPLRDRIRERLNQLLNTYAEYIRDPLITMRRDRYAIPVIASFQSRVPGIALDSSDSGQTLFIEPQAVVPMNNELALLEFEERDEVRRILIALGQRLAYEEGLDETLELLTQLDLINASARLAKDWQLAKPSFNTEGKISLVDARHPLIENCIPNSIQLDQENHLLVITGPNAGGKTVLLKTLGLATLMAHSGLFVAANGYTDLTLPFFEALLIDIGDEQSIAASLSTYAGHLTNLKAIVDQASPSVLILIDELGSGTDPDEGAALSQAILEQVLASGAPGLITTHLAPLKIFASETKGIQNAAMRFDVEALKPTYNLTVGQPGRSYALSIADRIGLSKSLLDRASDILGPEGERLERLLEALEMQRARLEQDVSSAEEARDQAFKEAEILRAQIERLRRREEDVIAAAAEKADEMLQDTLQRAKELKRTATSDMQQRSSALEELQKLRKDVQKKVKPKAPPPVAQGSKKLEPGAVVYVEDYDAEGPIVELRGQNLIVQLGLLKVEVPRRGVKLVKSPEPPKAKASSYVSPSRFEEELNIRGERVEEGLEKVRDFIMVAQSRKAGKIRILHGKGTGALRDAVRNYLKNEKRIERYEDAVPYEGGHGVTVAYLRN